MHFLIVAAVLVSLLAAQPSDSQMVEDLHSDFGLLLDRYVTEQGVRYAAWAGSQEDLLLLTDYVDRLEETDVTDMERSEALAYWINVYNAVTLELVLSHYPVESIKKTAGFLKSPWNKKLVTIGGVNLSLDAIENDIIRPQFGDPRIHFALNCASIGCPVLAREPYRAAQLDEQLDEACRWALNDPRWVRIDDDTLVLSKIFDWYQADFEQDAGSVPAFIARYLEGDGKLLGDLEELDVKYASYDWGLNLSQ